MKLKIIIIVFFILSVSAGGYSITADEIIQKIDSQRLISNDFEMTIRVESYKNDRFQDSTVMKGYVKEGKMTMITYLEPASMIGRKILIHDNDIWIVVPNTKNPIRITASQRLMGGVSYGDVARVSYAEDYNAEPKGEDSIAGMNPDGSKSNAKKCFFLELSAKDRGANYNKIKMWVDEDIFLPVKADFYALSGKKMTTAYYTAPKEWEGKTFITKIFLYDQIITSKHSSMEYIEMKLTQDTNSTENSTNMVNGEFSPSNTMDRVR